MHQRALLVIDLQNDYFPGGKMELRGVHAAADNAARLIAAAREVGDLVVHVRHEFTRPDAPFFVAGSEGARTHAKVSPREGEPVIVKHFASSFRDTELKALLDRHIIREVVICGAMSHMCIDAATRAAADFGYAVTVVYDACATRDLEFGGVAVRAEHVHAAFMAALGSSYAAVKGTEELLQGGLM